VSVATSAWASGIASAGLVCGAAASELVVALVVALVLAHPAVQSRQNRDAAVIAAARVIDRLGLEFRGENAPFWSIFP
jgi:hypothetical protein